MCVVDELRTMRERWNMSTRDLEELLSLDTGRISHWENKDEIPGTKHLMRWADALGCNIKLEFRK